jgi:hypothetical protein
VNKCIYNKKNQYSIKEKKTNTNVFEGVPLTTVSECSCSNVYSAGIRGLDSQQYDFCKSGGISYFCKTTKINVKKCEAHIAHSNRFANDYNNVSCKQRQSHIFTPNRSNSLHIAVLSSDVKVHIRKIPWRLDPTHNPRPVYLFFVSSHTVKR